MRVSAWAADIDNKYFAKKDFLISNGKIVKIDLIDDKKFFILNDLNKNKDLLTACLNESDTEINKIVFDGPLILIPVFVDSHIHIESSMLRPDEFSRTAVCHGTGAVVADPHEIVNVCGIMGLNYMMRSAELTPMEIVFGVPSCVPACKIDLSGFYLSPEDTETLLRRKDTGFLGEVMDYSSVIKGDEQILLKIRAAEKVNKPVDGHCPGLTGAELEKYINAGITTDHEVVSLSEGEEKIKGGMKIQIRQGSASRDFEKLWPLVEKYPDQCMLCTDDLHPDDLEKGHINLMVSELLKRGVDFFKVIKAAAVNAVKHYNLKTGLLKKGDSADFILYDPVNFKIAATVLKGRIVSLNGEKKIKRNTPEQLESINNRNFSKNDFLIHHEKSCINVIRVIKDSLMTKRMKVRPNIIDGHAVSDINRDILRFSVVSRYNTDDIAHAFVNGFGIKYGAMASSVSHDSHNVAVIGADEESMARACELVFENQGGLVWYCPEESFVLPLSAAGLISLSDCADTAASYQKLNELVTKAGSLLRAPFMTLSFLSLPVIPDIKLTSKGLFDVRENKFRPLFEKC